MAWIYFLVTILTLPLWGWVTSAHWEWFIVPALGLPPISWLQAIGIMFTVSVIRYHVGQQKRDDDAYARMTYETIAAPFILWGFGRILAIFTGTA